MLLGSFKIPIAMGICITKLCFFEYWFAIVYILLIKNVLVFKI